MLRRERVQFELTHASAKRGPLLIFDRSFRERWANASFKEFILNQMHLVEAASGVCAWLERSGRRKFKASVEVVVGEAPPAHSVYAQQSVTGLRLQVPSGQVQLSGIVGAPLCTVEIPPGEYQADLFAYVGHPTRLENTLLPFEPQQTRWSLVVLVALGLSLLGTVSGLALAWPLSQAHSWQALAIDLGGIALCWFITLGLYVVSGERRRMRLRRRLFKRALARLPKVPDFTVVLRRTLTPPAVGGGVCL